MKYFIVSVLLLLSLCGFSRKEHVVHGTETTCPVCKSTKNSIPVVYGKPSASGIQRAEKGGIRLGGCIVTEDSPKHYCKKDKKLYCPGRCWIPDGRFLFAIAIVYRADLKEGRLEIFGHSRSGIGQMIKDDYRYNT